MIDQVMESVRGFLKTIDSIENDWDRIYEEIGLSDQEISDLLHEIELTDFNESEGNHLAEEIKRIRKHRRELKDYQEIIRHLKEFLERNRSLKISLYKVLNGMERTKNYHNSRYYTPRVRTDLKLCAKINQSDEEESDSMLDAYTDIYNNDYELGSAVVEPDEDEMEDEIEEELPEERMAT